jgi:hypothetical protein
MSGAVQSETIRCVTHSVNRFTIEIATAPQEFRARYERVVPLVPMAEVRSLAARRAPWGEPEGPAHFTFDQPSNQFASFGNPEITSVGFELDRKMAALLDNLHLPVPDALLTKG